MLKTFGSVFSGGGGADMGAKAAGLELLWGVEMDSPIAKTYALNLGPHIINAKAADVDLTKLPYVDLLWFSPPCQTDSNARNKNLPRRDDADAGLVIIDYVAALKPKVVVIENVTGYRNNPVFKTIIAALWEQGYFVMAENINAADLGVPQTRRRLIVRAVRDELFIPEIQTDSRWVGWYEAIKDLIPTLPESKFAEWQMKRLPESLKENVLVAATSTELCVRNADEPANTVVASIGSHSVAPKAYLVDARNNFRDWTTVPDERPSFTILSTSLRRLGTAPKALLMPSDNAGQEWGKRYRDEADTAMTLGASMPMPKAYVSDTPRSQVYKMTVSCLMRFQTFPDNYKFLPGTRGKLVDENLACKIIGNSVPPLMAQKILAQLAATY